MIFRHKETAAKLLPRKTVVHNPAPGRTLAQWAIDRTGRGHDDRCQNRSRLNVYPCDCGYEMAWHECFAMLPVPVPRVVDEANL